jgi:type II secretory pathway component PulJ
VIAVLYLTFLLMLSGQAPDFRLLGFHLSSETDTDHDGSKRAEIELSKAEVAFDSARDAYHSGKIEQGDADLDGMTKALHLCVDSLEAAHKARYYKKAELRVASLQRRMASLLDDIDLPRRGWAEQTSRELDTIHDRLLAGVMRK